jgi:hypothetical protein
MMSAMPYAFRLDRRLLFVVREKFVPCTSDAALKAENRGDENIGFTRLEFLQGADIQTCTLGQHLKRYPASHPSPPQITAEHFELSPNFL